LESDNDGKNLINLGGSAVLGIGAGVAVAQAPPGPPAVDVAKMRADMEAADQLACKASQESGSGVLQSMADDSRTQATAPVRKHTEAGPVQGDE
jgi:hypothetical protein